MEDYLASIYFNPEHSASFSGVDKLYRVVKEEGRWNISRDQIQKWLSAQDVYTLHHRVLRSFPRNRVVVSGIGSQMDMDLADMRSFSKKNKGYNHIILGIDIFSRVLYTRPLKTKTGKEVVKVLSEMLEKVPVKKIRTDKGSEWLNADVSAFFKRKKIHHFVTQNTEQKANYAERAIKTLKGRIMRFFTHKQTHEWLDHLQEFTESYNNSFHRSIGMTPRQVSKENESELWLKQYLPAPRKKKKKKSSIKPRKFRYKFQIGDEVRLSHIKAPFDREYDQRWTGEIFKVTSRSTRAGLAVYTLEDLLSEKLTGTFYEAELQHIRVDPKKIYKLDKIIKKRKRKGRKEVFVRWLHWPSKFDSWIPESDIVDL
jgi:hypothetical protein